MLALFIALDGTSYAATSPSSPSGGRLYACVTDRYHTLSLTSPAADCPLGQEKISFDQAPGWALSGNAGAPPPSEYLGTTDNKPLNLDVDGSRALELQPNATSPNLIGGSHANTVVSGTHGATVAGGGDRYSVTSWLERAPGTQPRIRTLSSGATENFGRSKSSDFTASGSNQFDVRATGGVTVQTNAGGTYSTGCRIAAGGGSWSCTSDRNAKRDFAPVSDQQVLQRLARLPIDTWSYKTDPTGTRHIGPTAQDFKAAFEVGNDPRSIGLFDEGGVTLAAIQGLYRQLLVQQAQIYRLQARLSRMSRSQ